MNIELGEGFQYWITAGALLTLLLTIAIPEVMDWISIARKKRDSIGDIGKGMEAMVRQIELDELKGLKDADYSLEKKEDVFIIQVKPRTGKTSLGMVKASKTKEAGA